jgi:hypothetical protein
MGSGVKEIHRMTNSSSSHTREFHRIRPLAVAVLLTATSTLGGCQTEAQNDALIGGLLGAGLGGIIGHQSGEGWAGAGSGAAAGALGGYVIGNEIDKDRRDRAYGYTDQNRDYNRRSSDHPRYDY